MKMKLMQTADLDSLYDEDDCYGGFVPKQKKQVESDIRPIRDNKQQDRSKLREAKRSWDKIENS